LVYISPHDTPLCDILPTAISCLVLVLDGYFQNAVLCAFASLYHAPFLRGGDHEIKINMCGGIEECGILVVIIKIQIW
jgi:hypothetical protein